MIKAKYRFSKLKFMQALLSHMSPELVLLGNLISPKNLQGQDSLRTELGSTAIPTENLLQTPGWAARGAGLGMCRSVPALITRMALWMS